jgi:predicted secreted protein
MAVGIGVSGILYINTGTDASPTYTLIGGQRNASLDFSKKTVDITNKGDFGWDNFTATTRGVTVDVDGLVDEADAGFQQLRLVFWNNVSMKFRFNTPSGVTYSGTFELDSLNESYPYDDAVGYKASLKSKGTVTKA